MSKIFENIISNILKPEEFKKKAKLWYKESQEIVVVLELQKSQYGKQFYINIGAGLKELLTEIPPKEHKCHIRTRLTQICKEGDSLKNSLDLENNTISNETRHDVISKCIMESALPLFSKWLTIDSLKEFINDNDKRFLISGRLTSNLV